MKNRIMLSCLPALCLFVLTAYSQAEEPFAPDDYFPVRIENADRSHIPRLTEMKINVTGVQDASVDVDVTEEQLQTLRRLGYRASRRYDPARDPSRWASYPSFSELTTDLQTVAANYPALCSLQSMGDSVQGRELWIMKISDHVNLQEDEPEFRYISSMHGNEVVGMEMCRKLIHLLTESYGTDPQITHLVNETEIWIMPLMNPDGYVSHSRYNAQGVDLNRDFPDRVQDPVNTTAGRAWETQLVMNWGFTHSPVLSANFHGGALVVNYPYDSDPNPNASYSATPDDDLIIQQSLAYASLNSPMYNSSSFNHGIVNGIEWYLAYGTMQDWNYVWMSCNDVTIELGNDKWPYYSQIINYWNDNRDSMLAYMEWCHRGVRGLVTCASSGLPLPATVRVAGNDHSVFTDPDGGDYHRMLLPGTYSVEVSAQGYVTQVVHNVSVGSGEAVRVDVALVPEASLIAFPDALDTDTGGTIQFVLTAGAAQGNRDFYLLASGTGTVPGLPLPGGLTTLPLNWDMATELVISMANSPALPGFFGFLDSQGNGTAQLIAPPLAPVPTGTFLHFAYLLIDPFDYVSNPAPVEIVR